MSIMGAFLPPLVRRADIAKSASRLRSRGTCLSRSLALAARMPEAEVVIGAAPRRGERLFAHAWVELRGEPVHMNEDEKHEIGRVDEIGRL